MTRICITMSYYVLKSKNKNRLYEIKQQNSIYGKSTRSSKDYYWFHNNATKHRLKCQASRIIILPETDVTNKLILHWKPISRVQISPRFHRDLLDIIIWYYADYWNNSRNDLSKVPFVFNSQSIRAGCNFRSTPSTANVQQHQTKKTRPAVAAANMLFRFFWLSSGIAVVQYRVAGRQSGTYT